MAPKMVLAVTLGLQPVMSYCEMLCAAGFLNWQLLFSVIARVSLWMKGGVLPSGFFSSHLRIQVEVPFFFLASV